jgi:hypothetical protein
MMINLRISRARRCNISKTAAWSRLLNSNAMLNEEQEGNSDSDSVENERLSVDGEGSFVFPSQARLPRALFKELNLRR